MHIRAAFEEGACGAVAFAWTDEWWRGGHPVDDWAFGLVDRSAAAEAGGGCGRGGVRRGAVPAADAAASGRRVSVVVCAYNAADTHRGLPLLARAADLSRLRDHPRQRRLARSHQRDRPRAIRGVRVIDIPNGGLSAARNVGLAEATGEIVAYTDADTRVDRDWLTFLVQPFLTSDVVGSGGPNVVPRRRSADGAVHRARARAGRRTCCSTTASPSTCPAATWRSAATRSSRSAASIRSTFAPATTWTCAGGCRRAAGRSASRRRRSSGTTIDRR